MDKLTQSVQFVKKFCPNYQIKDKGSSGINKAIGRILAKVGNPSYMSYYVTTLGQTTYIPNDSDPDQLWKVVLHEGQHALDAQKMGNVPFGLLYLSPQIVGILGVLYSLVVLTGLFFGWSAYLLLGCLSLAFLAPIPSPGRSWAEIRGYTVTLCVDFWTGHIKAENEKQYIDWIVSCFTGPGYYYMWPLQGIVRAYFEEKLLELKTNKIELDVYLRACKTFSFSVK